MPTKLENMFEAKLSEMVIQLKAMREDYKREIESMLDTEVDVDAGIASLEDALRGWKKEHDEPEEHSNSSRANARTYNAEMREG